MKINRTWGIFGLIVILGFLLIQVYVLFLQSKITPFRTAVTLGQTGSSNFNINSFYSADYTMMLAIDHPQRTNRTFIQKDWEEFEKNLHNEFDVNVRILLKDDSGSIVINHLGSLNDWRLTNRAPIEESDGAFWKYRFKAKLFEEYLLEIDVLESNSATKKYNPVLLFQGIDDGYFFLLKPVLNTAWGIVAILLAIVVFLIQKSMKHRAT